MPWPTEADYDPADVPLHPYLLDTPETRQAAANYYTDATRMDREVGCTLDLLDEAELTENTVFIYTADQGPQLPHATWELYDYGINVPFLVRWPGRVEGANRDPAARGRVRVYQQRPEEELYDLRDDPHELHNWVDDPVLQSVKNELRGRMEQWMAQQGDEGRHAWSTRFEGRNAWRER